MEHQDRTAEPSQAHPVNPIHAIPQGVTEILKHKLKSKNADGSQDVEVELHFWDSGGQVKKTYFVLCDRKDCVYSQ